MSRRSYGSVLVRVDASDVLEDIDDDDLLAEIRARKLGDGEAVDGDWLERLLWFLHERDVHGAIALAEAALRPARNFAAIMTQQSQQGTIQ